MQILILNLHLPYSWILFYFKDLIVHYYLEDIYEFKSLRDNPEK